jgi:subtilisin-like proprotein convertase family protein
MKKTITTLLAAMLAVLVFAQTKNNPWQDVAENAFAAKNAKRLIVPSKYRTLSLNQAVLDEILSEAPMRFTEEAEAGQPTLSLPMPDGSFQNFKVVEAPVMHPDLAAEFPYLRSYAGWSKEDPTAYLRFGVTQKGFHAVIFSARHSTAYIDVFAEGDTEHYISYFKKDYSKNAPFECLVDETPETKSLIPETPAPKMTGDCKMRTYALALACTGEYAQFHGGTVPAVMAEYTVAMTRINGIYEREAGVTMVLVPNTNLLIFLNASTDPYTNGNGSAMLNQNQTTCNNIIGNANYDIGHVFSTGGGGVAFLNSVCSTNNKAKGVTGQATPTGDPFWVDYVAHEMGHQFGGNHTQNNSCNRNGPTAVEPGSASTIMGYAGICAPNVQNNSDDYFHAINLDEIAAHVTGFGNSCATTTVTGNSAPTVTVPGGSYSVPISTPLVLTAAGTDPNGDILTYCWEQMDNEVAPMPPVSTNTGGPAFRSLKPQQSPSRYLPDLPSVISGATPTWEVLPSVTRTMFFRCTVRDNHGGAGCTDEADVILNFTANAGPFKVSSPNVSSIVWNANSVAVVTWDVANTNTPPVNCSQVDILLSIDGGLTYPYALLTMTPNDGSQIVPVPNITTNKARVMVKSRNNVFYDISDQNFTIDISATPTFVMTADPPVQVTCPDGEAGYTLNLQAVNGFNESVSLMATGAPASATVTFSPANATPPATVMMTISNLQNADPGAYPITVTATSLSETQTADVSLIVLDSVTQKVTLTTPADGATGQVFNPTPVSWQPVSSVDNYLLEVSENPSFQTIFYSAVTGGTTHQVPGTEEGKVYYWRVKGMNVCNVGPFSDVFAFQTSGTECEMFTSINTPVPIPDDQATFVTDVISVPNISTISSVKVHLNLSHTYPGDLIVMIDAPQGNPVLLFDQPGVPNSAYGCDGDDMYVNLYDEAPNSASALENTCNSVAPAIGGDFQPLQPLLEYQGQNSAGNWTLILQDVFEEDGGAIKDWAIEICAATSFPPAVLIKNEILVVAQGQSENVTNAELLVSGTPAFIVFTLISIPENGTLYLQGNPLEVGSTFTQAQINSGLLTYEHDGSMTSTDNFHFDVLNGVNGWLHNQLFQIEIIENSLAASAAITQNIDCHNANNATVTVTATGGTAPLEYALNGGSFQSSNIFENLAPGAYTAEVMDATGFTITTNDVTVSNPAAITASATVMDDDITVDASGGTGTLQYSLDGGPFQSSNVFENLPNGGYTITVQDENGCTETVMATVSVNTLAVSAAITQAISCFGENDGEITATVSGGSSPFEYSLNGGAFQSSHIFQNLAPGTYTIEAMDAGGFTQTTSAVVLSAPTQIMASAAVMDDDITVDASGGTGTLQYSLNGGAFQSSNIFENLPNGTYTITVQDENGCTASVTATVMVNTLVVSAAVSQPVSCFDENDGEITVTVTSGSQPFEYSLNGGAFQSSNIFQNLAAGIYTVMVMDGDGFTQTTLPVTIASPAQINGSAAAAGYLVEVTASGGTGALQYSLDGGVFQSSPSFFPVPSGTHTVVVKDGNGCETTIPVTVNVPALTASAVISQNLPCWNSATGEITVTGGGGVPPYEYSLNGGAFQSSNIFNGLAPGSYTMTIRDSGGFTFSAAPVMLTAPLAIVVSPISAGSIVTVNASGGTPPYQYQLDGGSLQMSNVFMDVTDGMHTVNVVDANGCEMSASINVLSVPPPVITVSIEQELSCYGDSSAVISVNVSGGIPPFQYSLNGGNFQPGNVFSGLSAGIYQAEVEDANGDIFTTPSIAVTAPPAITASASVSGLTITVTANGGTGSLQFSLDGGAFQNNNQFNVASNGTYTVTVMDENGCTVEANVVVSVPTAMQFAVSSPSCFGLMDGLIVIQGVTGGIPPFLYSMNGGAFTSSLNYPGLSPGQYIFTVQDATGYQYEAPPVAVNPPLPVEAMMEIDGNNLKINASGGTGPYLYSIDGGQSFQSGNLFTDLPNGFYEVVVVDDNGCAYGTTVTINYNSVQDLPGRLAFEVLPNPSDGLFTLRMDLTTPVELQLAVFDVAGKLVFRSKIKATGSLEEYLDLRFLASGSYQLRVNDQRTWGVKRLVIVK